MKTVDIKGKPYVEVNERIKYFRTQPEYRGWSLVTEIVEMTDERVVMKASVLDEDGAVRATGTAFERADSSYINKTSYIENCETSAWGRALGNLGIGIDAAIASADEMRNAIENQNKPLLVKDVHIAALRGELERTGWSEESMLEYAKVESIEKLPMTKFVEIMKKLEKRPDAQ